MTLGIVGRRSQRRFPQSPTVFVAMVLFATAAAALALYATPNTPLVIIGVACGATVALYMLQKPLAALCVALFLFLLPLGLRIGGVYEIVVNLAILLAMGAFILQLPFERRPFVWNAVCFAIALYIGWGVVTLLWAPDLVEGRRKLVAYAMGLIFVFLASNQIRALDDVDKFMKVLGATGWLFVIAGLEAAFFGDYQFGNRLKVLDENENVFGLILIVMVPGIIWPVLRSSGPRRTLLMTLSMVYIICSLVLVVLSGSRGSTISMVIVLLSFCFTRTLRPWGAAVALIAAGVLVVAPFLLDTIIERFKDPEGGDFGGRTIFWQASLMLIRDYPLTGAGIGNGQAKLIEYVRVLTSDYNYRSALVSHSALLEVGIDTGVAGMVIFLGMCVAAVASLVRHRHNVRDMGQPAYFPIVAGVAAGYFASAVKSGGLGSHPIFFVLLVLLVVPSSLSKSLEPSSRLPSGSARPTAPELR